MGFKKEIADSFENAAFPMKIFLKIAKMHEVS
jgi:hypothetical protein